MDETRPEKLFFRRVILEDSSSIDAERIVSEVFNPDNNPDVVVPTVQWLCRNFYDLFGITPLPKNASVRASVEYELRSISRVLDLTVEQVAGAEDS